MPLNSVVRRAIADRMYSRRRAPSKPGAARLSVAVRLVVDPTRIRNIGGRERQINLTNMEFSRLQPVHMTLFSSAADGREVRLIVNRRRAWLLSVSNTGILVFTYSKIG